MKGIPNSQVTVVLQGDLRPGTRLAIDSVREALPGARLVLSTFAGATTGEVAGLVDAVIASRDPGALPPATFVAAGPANNINRQIVSTRAGLSAVQTPYALKMRTDCLLRCRSFIDLYEGIGRLDQAGNRIVASSFFTRHPRGIAAYQFHLSDWFLFAKTTTLQTYWSRPLVSLEEATWFEHSPHRWGSTAIARRFRARYTQEQFLATAYARTRGYLVPDFLDDRQFAATEYERFLAHECIVASPEELGFELPKYARQSQTLYQSFDCVIHSDWESMFYRQVLRGSRRSSLAGPARRQARRETIRKVLASLRHPICVGLRVLLAFRNLRAARRFPKGPPALPGRQQEFDI